MFHADVGTINGSVNSNDQRETPLAGGHMNSVVRVGDTVRRRMGPWSAGVHGLLRQIEAAGFTSAPRFLGIANTGARC